VTVKVTRTGTRPGPGQPGEGIRDGDRDDQVKVTRTGTGTTR